MPDITPISSAITNQRILVPPKRARDKSTKTTVREVFKDRTMVCIIEWLTTVAKDVETRLFKFSLIRSKTTIVS